MIIRKHGYVLDVDIEGTSKYSQEHNICGCDEDRNLYAQIADKFPKFAGFQTWGSGKGDDSTSGYDEDLTPGYLMLEG